MYLDYYYNQNRGFIVPFLIGGLAGGAAVGLTRPRPIYNIAPSSGYYQNTNMPYYNSSYSYYQPISRPIYY